MLSEISLNQFVLVITLGFTWWRMVRFTRESNQKAVKRMEDQFWINHSLDLEIPVGLNEHEQRYGDKKLVIRGLEIREHGWWLDRNTMGNDGYTDWKHQFKANYRFSKTYAQKAWYYIWRNIRPFADLDLECTFLIEAQNCRIGTMENEKMVEGIGRELSGQMINEVFNEIDSLRQISSDPNLYRITLNTYDDYRAVEVFGELASSSFVRDKLYSK